MGQASACHLAFCTSEHIGVGLYQGTASAVPTDLDQKNTGFSPRQMARPARNSLPRTDPELVAANSVAEGLDDWEGKQGLKP